MTAAQRLSANRMIDAKGLAVTLTRRASGAYNPATSGAAVTVSTQTGKGVILPVAGSAKAPGSTVVEAEKQCLLSALAASGAVLTAPSVGDRLNDGTRDYEIVTVAPLAPAGLDIMYDLRLKAAK